MGHFRSKNCKVRYSDCPGMNDIQRGSGPHASLCRPASASPLPQERGGGTLGFRLTTISNVARNVGEVCFTAYLHRSELQSARHPTTCPSGNRTQ